VTGTGGYGGPPVIPGSARLPNGLRALRHRNFRLFWTGQLISLVGTWMQQVAQGWLVLELTGDPLILGAVAAAQFTPVIILGLFAGVFADAFPKRAILMATQIASAVLALVLGLLVATGTVEVWHVFVLASLLGVANAFDMPVRQAFVVEMVGRDDMVNAVGLNSSIFNGSRIVGPAIAGLLIATVGLAVCFLLNAVSYVAVVIGLLAMRPQELHKVERSQLARSVGAVIGQLAEGLRYVRDEPTIRLALGVLGVVATVALNFQVLLPLLARDVLGGGADTFGFLMAASGVGSLASSLAIAFGQRPTLRLLLTGAAVIGLASLGVAYSTWLPLSMVLMAFAGWGLMAMAATTNTLIQLRSPDVLRGRVMSVYTTVFAGSSPIGGLFAGTLANAAGVAVALATGGVLAVLTAAAALSRLPPDRASARRGAGPPAAPKDARQVDVPAGPR